MNDGPRLIFTLFCIFWGPVLSCAACRGPVSGVSMALCCVACRWSLVCILTGSHFIGLAHVGLFFRFGSFCKVPLSTFRTVKMVAI